MADAESRGELWGDDKPAPVRLFWAINSLEMVCRNLAAVYERLGEHEKLPSPRPRDYLIGQVTDLLPKVDEMCDRVRDATHNGGAAPLDEALNPGAKSQQLALMSLVHKVWLTAGSVAIGMIEDLHAQACMGNDVDALRRLGGELNTINEQLRAAMALNGMNPFRRSLLNDPDEANTQAELPELKPWAMEAWRSHQASATMTQIAETLTDKYGEQYGKITQPRVSEQITAAKAHAVASGLDAIAAKVLPGPGSKAPARTLDPAVADLGRRTDGQAHHIREKMRQIAEDAED